MSNKYKQEVDVLEKKKKKRIYAKDKTPVLETTFEIDNPMRLIMALQKKENIWSEYIDRVIYRGEETGQKPDQDLNYVLKQVKDKKTRRSILGFIMKLDNYNPFEDAIPVDRLPENYKVYLTKIQSKIRFNIQNVHNLTLQQRDFVYQSTKYKGVVTEFTKTNFNAEIFAMGFDFIILQKEGRYLFNSNPKLKHFRPDLKALYDQLTISEPDKWYLHGNNFILMTKNGTYSNLNLKQIFSFMNKLK